MKKLINLSMLLILLFGMIPPITATAVVSTLWEQMPGGDNGCTSYTDSNAADDFIFSEAATINQVEFWTSVEGPVEIHIAFYSNTVDSSGYNMPDGAPFSSYVSTSSGSLEDSSICSQPYCTYRHIITLDTPLQLSPDHYWMSIYATSQDDLLIWSYDASTAAYGNAVHWSTGGLIFIFRNLTFRLLEVNPVLVVNSNNDVVDSSCDATHCSLREAVLYAESGDMINFAPSLSGATITLASQLTLDKDVTIDSSALDTKVTVTTDNMDRVVQVYSGVTATLDSLRITHGNITGSGGGIYNQGNLTVNNTDFVNNLSSQYGGGIYNTGTLSVMNSSLVINGAQYGGGIFNEGGTLEVMNSSFDQNSVSSQGGGIYNDSSGIVSVTDTTLSGNTAISAGGGIANYSGTTTIKGSTLTENQATGANASGGGLYNLGTMTVANSTLNTNTASQYGGGICNYGTMDLWNSTLSGNVGHIDGFEGHGLANLESGILYYSNIIIANSPMGCACYNEATIYMSSNSIVEEDWKDGCQAAYNADPLLGDLADNGGSTLTMALQEGSLAIDAGNDENCSNDLVGGVDQRGVTRPQGSNCDIGAYEYEEIVSSPPVINYIDIGPEPSFVGWQVWGTANFSDPDSSSSYSVEVNWGDGTVEPGGDCDPGWCDLKNHTYENDGNYTVTVSITDGEGQTGTGSTQHEVTYVMALEEEAQWLASNTLPTTLEIYGETLSGHTPLNFTIVTQPEQGSITDPTFIDCQQREWAEDLYTCRAEVTYTPVNGDIGDYSFTFTVDDGQGNVSSPGTVHLWVRGNEAPTAIPGNAMVSSVVPKTISLHATDPDFYNNTVDRLSFFIDMSPTSGTLGSISTPDCYLLYDEFDQPTGVTCTAEVLYTPFEGTTAVSDSFTFYVNDTHQNSDTATISLDLHHPTTLIVNNEDDVVDTNGCDDTHCSLREAVAAAELGDVVAFAPTLADTITLSQEILIDNDMVINGPGADQLAISGGGLERDNPDGTRVFIVGSYESNVNVTISGLTIRDGRASSGGGVYVNRGSTLAMNDCVIGPNNIVTYAGGGIFNNGGHLTLNRCTVTENEGTGSLGGAGVTTAYDAATTMITNSTISGNITNNYGGGLFVGQDCIVTLIHTTVSGNISNENYLDPGEERGGGAGIYIDSESYSDNLVYLKNSIIAGNTDMTDPFTAEHDKWPDVYGQITSLGGNIIGDPTGSMNEWDITDQVGTAGSPLDPLLGALMLNEPGITLTMALLEGSPAIDAAPNCEVTIDQRGVGRPQGDGCDIGAYELEQTSTYGELKITKVIDPLTSGFTGTFTIDYNCDDGTAHDGTVDLAAGESQTITGIPTGTQCTVTEPTLPTAPTGWTFGTPTFSPETGVVTVSEVSPAYVEVVVTNSISRDLGELKISKIFDPLTSGFTGKFTISYDCDDGTTHDGTVTLGAGESQKIAGIPTGTTCTVVEPTLPTAPTEWTFGTPTFSPETGVVTVSEDSPAFAEVIVTNSITRDQGELKISKVFDPLTSEFTGTFTISYDCDDDTNGTVDLAAGESQTITGIPTGTSCTVTEPTLPNAPTGWYFELPAYNPPSGVVTVKEGINEVSVTNTIISEEDNYKIFLPLINGGTSDD